MVLTIDYPPMVSKSARARSVPPWRGPISHQQLQLVGRRRVSAKHQLPARPTWHENDAKSSPRRASRPRLRTWTQVNPQRKFFRHLRRPPLPHNTMGGRLKAGVVRPPRPKPEPADKPLAQGIDKSVPAPRRYPDRDHLRHVEPCLICGRKPSDPHHPRYLQPRALGGKSSDEFVVSLCP